MTDPAHGLSEGTKRRLALFVAGWHFQDGIWRRATGEAMSEALIDALPQAAFVAALGERATVANN
jgi:hypothetical protein